MATILPPVRIVYYSYWFGSIKFEEDDPRGRNCPIPDGYSFDLSGTPKGTSWCTLTSSQDDWENASGLIFHAADSSYTQLPPRIDNQPRILETLESPVTAPFRTNPEQMKNYDYLASYNFKSSFLFTYFSPAIMDVANRPLPKNFMKTKKKGSPILWIARNCMATSGRQKYVNELMKHINVHSYGSCENNMEFPEDKERLELMSEYKFYLAIENANCEDYATEKLYDTFMMSAVPIVDGPPSYDGYLPTNKSVVYMDAFPDPKDLADYINYLDNNDEAYLEYLSFRRDAMTVAAEDRLEPAFIKNWGDADYHNKRSDYCSICRGVLPWWRARHTPGAKPYKDKSKKFLTDQSCQPAGKWDYIASGRPYKPDWTPRPLPGSIQPPEIQQEVQPEPPVLKTKQDQVAETLKESTHNVALLANVSFLCLVVLFVTFLLRRSRKKGQDIV